MVLFPIHLMGLLLPGFWLGRVFRLPPALHVGAIFLIFEASLVLGAGVLSAAKLLGHQHIYQITTTLIACGLATCLWFIGRHEAGVRAKSESFASRKILRTCLVLAGVLVFWLAGSALLTWAEGASYRRALQVVTMLVVLGIAMCALVLTWRGIWPLADSSSHAKPGRNARSLVAAAVSLSPIVCLAIFAILMLWLTLNAVPAVEDSLTIKLPKVVFAIESNSLLPSDLTDDPRMYMSPVYPALIQLFFIINGYNSHALLVFGFINWLVCGSAIYHVCRSMNVSQWVSWATLALVLLSPVVLAQGTSEGDDIIAATPFIISLAFFVSWLQTDRRLDAILAGLGLGLAVGIKFFPLFYAPAILLVVVLAIWQYSGKEVMAWLRAKASGAIAGLAAFVLALAPHAIANWVAFGNPLYVSNAVAATRNAPFSLDCALRNLVGYSKEFLFSDLARFVSWISAPLFAPLSPSSLFSVYKENIAASNKFFAGLFPYDPTLACSAWGNEFIVTQWTATETTYWFGIFGPLLLLCAIFVVVSRKQPFLARSLGVAFVAWTLTFLVTQRYIGGVGRYWSISVLAASPTFAVATQRLIEARGTLRIGWFAGIITAAVVTIFLALEALMFNPHRSLIAAVRTSFRYIDGFGAELRGMLKKAGSVNVQVIYAVDTYDFYMLVGKNAKLLNKADILDGSVNIAVVRPWGVTDNPFGDPRIPVQANRPFAGGFRYVGTVPTGFGFANNTELVEGNETDPRSRYLLFQLDQVKREGSTLVGYIHQIANSRIVERVRYRMGWRGPGGAPLMDGDWQRGLYGQFRVPAGAVALVLEVAFENAGSEVARSEWPMTGLSPGAVEKVLDARASPVAGH